MGQRLMPELWVTGWTVLVCQHGLGSDLGLGWGLGWDGARD